MDVLTIGSGSSGNCYRLSDGRTTLLLDCGLPLHKIQQATGFGLADISACLITHHHQDHCKAAADLAQRGVRCYAPLPAAMKIGRSVKPIKTDDEDREFLPLTVGTYRVIAFPVPHIDSDGSPCPCYGYLIYSTETKEQLVYITDAMYCRYRFPAVDYIMVECNYMDSALFETAIRGLSKRVLRSHMSLDTCLELLRANDLSRVKRIYLLHLSDERSNAAEMERQVRELTGKEVTVC